MQADGKRDLKNLLTAETLATRIRVARKQHSIRQRENELAVIRRCATRASL